MINKNDIKKLVIEHKKSTLKNHWKDIFFSSSVKYNGEIRSYEILLWCSTYFLRGTYPIFILSFDNNENLTNIKIEKNPYHKFLNKQSVILVVIWFLILVYNFDLQELLIYTFFMLLIVYLSHLVLSKAQKYEINLQINELRETIENIERKKNPEIFIRPKEEENEFTTSKFFTRLILYPFCIFFIWFFITNLSLKEMNIKIFIGIGIILTYLISDIILLIKKKS